MGEASLTDGQIEAARTVRADAMGAEYRVAVLYLAETSLKQQKPSLAVPDQRPQSHMYSNLSVA